MNEPKYAPGHEVYIIRDCWDIEARVVQRVCRRRPDWAYDVGEREVKFESHVFASFMDAYRHLKATEEAIAPEFYPVEAK